MIWFTSRGIWRSEKRCHWQACERPKWDILYADDAGIVSRSAERLKKTMTVIVTVFGVVDLTVSETKTEAMLLRTPDLQSLAPPLVIEATGQRYRQATQFLYLGGVLHESAALSLEIGQRIRLVGNSLNGSDRSCIT